MLNLKFSSCLNTLFLFTFSMNALHAQDKGNERLARRIEPIAKEYFSAEAVLSALLNKIGSGYGNR